MKITSYEATTLKVPETDPLANMEEEKGRTRPVVALRLRTDNGLEGIGVTFYGGKMTGSLRVAVEELAALTVGEDPLRIEHIVAKLRAGRRFQRAGRHLHAGALGDRHRALGHQGQGAGAALVEAARRPPRPGADLRVRLAAPRPDPRPGAGGRAHAGQEGLQGDEDADGAAGQPAAARGGPPRAARARGDRPGHQADVRHQPALAAGAGDRHRQPRRGCRPVLARGRDHGGRLPGPRPGHRRAQDADRRRRVSLGHRAVPPHDRWRIRSTSSWSTSRGSAASASG